MSKTKKVRRLLEQVELMNLERARDKELLAEKEKEIKLVILKLKEFSKGKESLSLDEV